MKRYLKHIFLSLTLCVLAASCMEELDSPQPAPGSDALTLVPRVTSFANRYVTKAGYGTDETKITSLAVLVFNEDGALVHIQEGSNTGGISTLTLNKSLLNSPEQDGKLDNATLVMIANADLDTIKDADGKSISDNRSALTLDGLDAYTFHFEEGQTVVTSLGDGFTGFPMIGTATADLTPTSSVQSAIEVKLQILYAKVNFSITVAEGGENQNLVDPKFTLSGYTVNNVSKRTSYAAPAEGAATASDEYAYTEAGFSGNTTGTAVLRDTVKFTFYVAESRYEHGSDLKGIYPDDSWLTSEHYDEYKQQYKPKIAAVPTGKPGTGLATYVTLSGTYNDYRGTAWTVSYDVYLGKDNSQNFEVDRNSEYTNIITIKGIRNNDSYGENQVWFDHRVDVSETTDHSSYVTITRETLVDAHFEVRPLRVKLPESIDRAFLYLPKYKKNNGAQITETETGENENWIAVENNNGRVKDITQYSSNGKRKYFTTSLIKQLYLENNDETYGIRTNEIDGDPREGQKYIQLFDGDCAWIYIDENVKEGEREAEIELVFYDSDANAFEDVEKFIIKQQGLYTTESGFNIENYEEYLHTYDSQDLYTNPLTDYTQQGYKWGLEGINLSNTQNVVSLGNAASTSYYYDFFHVKDREYSTVIGSSGTYEVVGGNIADNHGLNFTNNAGISNEMTIIDMNTRPTSAIQYCLSKNKFRVDDSAKEEHEMDVHWYLPDVYEMTQILTEGESTFSDFSENTYWTSQPAWTTSLLYLVDDTENARAVSLDASNAENYIGTPTSRGTKHRIRCAYSAEGVEGVDFSGTRAPEGIGAMRFYMRAWKDWDTKEPGYFSWDGCLQEDDDTDVTDYALPDTYPFPKEAADADEYFGPYVDGYGFAKDPSDQNNWKTETVNYIYTSYVTLYKWPGLTTDQVVSQNTLTGNNVYYALSGTKEETKGTTTTYFVEYDGDITAGGLKPLDHLYDGSDLTIEFSKGDDAQNYPKFEYYKENRVESKKTTRTWRTPIYVSNDKVESEDIGPIYTPSGKVILTAAEESDRASKNGTIETNNDGYIYPDEQTAIAEGNSIIPSDAYNKSVVAEKSAKSWGQEIPIFSYTTTFWGQTVTTYKRAARYRYKVTYTLDGQTVTYYQYDKDGCWIEGDEVDKNTPNNEAPTDDQLTMYGGNSFKITANNDNEISSVKIYFSDSNVVDELGSGKDYLRFTKDGFTGASNENPPGMSYSEDGEKGTMTWTGDPQTELTFKLVLLRKTYDNIFGFGDPDSFQYISNNDGSKAESIIIDEIHVRYKKKETTDSGTTE